jgi:hypothetical protein
MTYSQDEVSIYGKYIGINKVKETCELTILKVAPLGLAYPAVLLNQEENQSFEDFSYLDTAAVSVNKKLDGEKAVFNLDFL